MRGSISKDKTFKFLECILYIGFSIVAGWFASGVLKQYCAQKTSISQNEGEIKTYPVISMIFSAYKASEVNLTNVMILYHTRGMNLFNLTIGENHLYNDKHNKTEKVILDSLEDSDGRRVFRIIHTTPILDRDRPYAGINMYTKLEMKNGPFSDEVKFCLTSQENSPGFFDMKWKDGRPLRIMLKRNTFVQYSVEPKMIKYLEEMGKCQKESYYECIASQIGTIGFKNCSNKCIPDEFSIVGKNYSIPSCGNITNNHKQCIFNHKKYIASNCKKSCSIVEYSGEFEVNNPYNSMIPNWNMYIMIYVLSNQDFELIVYEQYLIYDTIGMMGSVGGTVGMFI